MVEELKLFLNKKNITTLFVLMIMVVILPLGIALIRQQQIFFSKASGERIQLGTGRCIQERNGTKVLVCPEVPLNLTAPFDPTATTSASPSPTGNVTSSLLNDLVIALELDEQLSQPISEVQVTATASGTIVVDGINGSKARNFKQGGRITVSDMDLGKTNFTLAALVNLESTTSATLGYALSTEVITLGTFNLNNTTDLNSACAIKGINNSTGGITGGPFNKLKLENWQLLICTYSADRILNSYINADKGATVQLDAGVITSNHGNLIIGQSPLDTSNIPFPGRIQSVMVWNRVLNANEITELTTNRGQLTSIFKSSFFSNDSSQNAPEKYSLSSLINTVIPEAKAQEVPGVCGPSGDVAGQGGFWDVQVNKCGEVLNYTEINNSCSASVQIRFRTPKWDATKKEWYTEKQDGKIITQDEIIDAKDFRTPGMDWIDSTSDSPYINCSLFFRYSGRTDCATVLPKNAQGISLGREGTELSPGGEITFTVTRDKPTANNNQPGCRQIIETDLNAGSVSNSPSPSPSANQCTAGNFGSAQMELQNNCGTVTTSMTSGAISGSLTYTAPNVTSDLNCNLKVTTANSGDCRLTNNGKGTASNPLRPNESMQVNFTNACVDNTPGCTLPIVISQAGAIPTDRAAYKLAESETGLNGATERGFLNQSFSTTYVLADQKPGMKQIWVEFIDKRTGQKTKDFLNVELVEQNPLIQQVGCNFDIQKNAVNFTVTGLRFGTEKATITANGQPIEISSWSDSSIKAKLLNANASGTQNYKVKVARKDATASEEVECKLGFTQLGLGAKLFCRGEGKFDLADVKLSIVDDAGNKAEETTAISKEGMISNLKTKFEIGRRYVVTIDAPRILKRNIEFTAKEGTTVITKEDGTTLFLPIGDIFPIATNGDGVINTLDQAELKRQWRSSTEASAASTLTADFNRDLRVNAFDWSCMRRDFGSTDDGLPSTPSSQSVGVDFTGSGSGSGSGGGVSVDFGLPTSYPNSNSLQDQVPQPDYPTTPQRIIQGTTGSEN